MVLSVAAPAFAATTDLTEEEMNGLTTPVSNVPSTEGFMVNGVNTMIVDTPAKYIFKPASSDTKSYILLKNVNAGENDGYFVMVQDGGLRADTADSAIAKLKKVYPGTSADGTTQAPTVVFDKDDKKSIAYYLNTSDYIDAQFPVMKDYINDHTWYTEGTRGNEIKPYKTNAKIALPSVTEYKANVDRIGVNSVAKGQSSAFSPVHFMLRTAHPGWIDSKHTSSKYTTKAVWLAKNNTDGTLQMQNGVAVFYWQTVERPCFYLSKDFFRNVKLDMSLLTTADSEAAKIIKEIAAEEGGIATLKNAGYTESGLAELGIAVGNVKITSAAISGSGKCGETITANVVTEGTADKTEYEWCGVKADGTKVLLTDDKTSKTYTIKFADLDYAKITCLVNVYSGTTLSQSAYANEITLETKPTFEKAPLTTGTSNWNSTAVTNAVATTDGKYDFVVDGKEYILLKSVNAGENDGQFVTLASSFRDESINWYTNYNEEIGFIYDPKDEKSIAYKLNTKQYFDKVVPAKMADYVITHRWWNEAFGSSNTGYQSQEAYATESKLALLSYTEYVANAERIGYSDFGRNALLRTPQYDWNCPRLGNPRVLMISNTEQKITCLNPTSGKLANYGGWHYKTVGFYLNPDFFANVKVDFTLANTEVVTILREKLADKTVDDLRKIGYSLTEIKELFPDKVANLGKIAMIDFSKDGNNVKFTCVNLSDGSITFKPVAAVYASDAMVCSNIGEEITLASGASKDVNVTLDVGTSTPDTLKAFAWNVATLTPFAPCKTVNYAALAPET